MSKLTTRQRKALASTPAKAKANFVFPDKAPGRGSYPVFDKARARAALSYGSRFLSPVDFAVLRAKVRSKFPEMKMKPPGSYVNARRAKASAARSKMK